MSEQNGSEASESPYTSGSARLDSIPEAVKLRSSGLPLNHLTYAINNLTPSLDPPATELEVASWLHPIPSYVQCTGLRPVYAMPPCPPRPRPAESDVLASAAFVNTKRYNMFGKAAISPHLTRFRARCLGYSVHRKVALTAIHLLQKTPQTDLLTSYGAGLGLKEDHVSDAVKRLLQCLVLIEGHASHNARLVRGSFEGVEKPFKITLPLSYQALAVAGVRTRMAPDRQLVSYMMLPASHTAVNEYIAETWPARHVQDGTKIARQVMQHVQEVLDKSNFEFD